MKKNANNLWPILTMVLVVLLAISVITNFQLSRALGGNAVAPIGTGQPAQAAPLADVAVGDSPSKGPDDAKVTIVEFSDFQCPFCGSAQATVAQIAKDYPNDVKLVFKQFPLGFHENAQKAAEASLCADEQGKFWEMHDKMFANQGALAVVNLKAYAKELGMDSAKFDTCLDSAKYEGIVKAEQDEGLSLGVQGTPTFYINGQQLVGAQPYSAFKAAVDAQLG